MTSEKIEQNLSLVIDNLNIEKANLNVNITETLYKNGDLDFIITNSYSEDDDEKKDGQYSLTLSFMNIGQNVSENYKTYKWKLTDIETGSKLPSA